MKKAITIDKGFDQITESHKFTCICGSLCRTVKAVKRDGVSYCSLHCVDRYHPEAPPSPYHVKNIWGHAEYIDFYMYYDQLKLGKPHEVGDSAIEHALKKASQAGLRSGGKSKIQDLEEAARSLLQAVEQIKAQNDN